MSLLSKQKNNDNKQIPIRQLEIQPHMYGHMNKKDDTRKMKNQGNIIFRSIRDSTITLWKISDSPMISH